MKVRDVDGLNSGYAQALLEQYLENPEAVPEEWRSLLESGDASLVEGLPGLVRLFETLKENGAPPAAPETTAEPVEVAAPPAEAAPAPAAPAPAREPEPEPAPRPAPEPAARAEADEALLGAVAAATALVKAYR